LPHPLGCGYQWRNKTQPGFSRIYEVVKRVWLKPLPFSSFIPALKSRATMKSMTTLKSNNVVSSYIASSFRMWILIEKGSTLRL
jgi:hypothetical protein